ncbi:MAG: SH3 domain-containing protein [Geitlerinemataceae cyanobacterium]
MNKFLTLLATVVATSIVPATAAFAEPTFPDRSHCDANLTANDPNSRITLRSGPGTDYRNLGYGLVGDRVYVLTNIPPELDYEFDRYGYGWYRIGFPDSGAEGWIREDLLSVDCRPIND